MTIESSNNFAGIKFVAPVTSIGDSNVVNCIVTFANPIAARYGIYMDSGSTNNMNLSGLFETPTGITVISNTASVIAFQLVANHGNGQRSLVTPTYTFSFNLQ